MGGASGAVALPLPRNVLEKKVLFSKYWAENLKFPEITLLV